MGLLRKELLPNGAEVTYWRVALAHISYDAREIQFTLTGFKDEKTRKATNAPLITRDIRLKGKEFDAFFDNKSNVNFRIQCYEAAKAVDPFFEGAEDV